MHREIYNLNSYCKILQLTINLSSTYFLQKPSYIRTRWRRSDWLDKFIRAPLLRNYKCTLVSSQFFSSSIYREVDACDNDGSCACINTISSFRHVPNHRRSTGSRVHRLQLSHKRLPTSLTFHPVGYWYDDPVIWDSWAKCKRLYSTGGDTSMGFGITVVSNTEVWNDAFAGLKARKEAFTEESDPVTVFLEGGIWVMKCEVSSELPHSRLLFLCDVKVGSNRRDSYLSPHHAFHYPGSPSLETRAQAEILLQLLTDGVIPPRPSLSVLIRTNIANFVMEPKSSTLLELRDPPSNSGPFSSRFQLFLDPISASPLCQLTSDIWLKR
ncbi:uncharacterized protein BDR25DRAFT_351570 [Lindgomyces ingoldianus]|uniref:Uncharacterized protein n=1 Tax=Lindgomyces ingoldianus TaxID=673940 RepID=A0ACB6R6T7_9PLEO|nr:uncharacterized protein BDR25DRAFT_351570 [Lindgomyces ingoldianus]KAF2474035.1 hypothetical protein BDR25DRAFT_351570 [Lindgomyces ingoldianus]